MLRPINQPVIMKQSFLASIILFLIYVPLRSNDTHIWGQLANPGFENDPVKSTVFFSGNWRNEVQFYDYNPSSNIGLYTMFPADSRHLGWSENSSFRDFAVKTMIDAGVNVICMSYWGLPGSDNWAHWSPMQSSTGSHDELFNTAIGKNILIAPFIESFAPTTDFPGFSFMDDFGGNEPDVSPEFVGLIEDLVERYIINPSNSNWPDKWARVYDQEGNERYMISIIHVASNKPGISDEHFADCFDLLADQIYESKGIHVGFALDILPPDTYAPGAFKATPGSTGSHLATQNSVLAIQCFIPEIWVGSSDESELIDWKRDFMSGWTETGIPNYHDISSGYDAHIVFPSSPVYGNNSSWRNYQTALIEEFESTSFTVSAWNGYTEGFAAVPTAAYGDHTYKWICEILSGTCGVEPEPEPDEIKESQESVTFTIYSNSKSLKIVYHLNQDSDVCFRIYNNLGAIMGLYQCSNQKAGDQEVEINMQDLTRGIYFISMDTGNGIVVKKFIYASM